MFTPRNGQWVTFTNLIEGAHLVDGLTVGIHIGGEVFPCTPTGENLVVGIKPHQRNLSLKVHECLNLRPLMNKALIPAARLATMTPDWKPKP